MQRYLILWHRKGVYVMWDTFQKYFLAALLDEESKGNIADLFDVYLVGHELTKSQIQLDEYRDAFMAVTIKQLLEEIDE